MQSNLLPPEEVIKDIGAVMDAQVHQGCSLSPLFILLEHLYNSGIDFEARKSSNMTSFAMQAKIYIHLYWSQQRGCSRNVISGFDLEKTWN